MTTRIEQAIAKLREAREKASQGPWTPRIDLAYHKSNAAGPVHHHTGDQCGGGLELEKKAKFDAAFIALSANVWQAMVGVIEASTDIRMQYNPSRSGEHGPALERFWHARDAFETAVLGVE